jgi:D-lactate dehydrogenase (cytochrome)
MAENDLDVVVQPGVKYQVLNQELEDRGTALFFPVDPGPVHYTLAARI